MHKKIENAVSRALNQTRNADSTTRFIVSSDIPPNQNTEGAACREQAVKRHLPPNQDDSPLGGRAAISTDGCDDLDKVDTIHGFIHGAKGVSKLIGCTI